MKHRQCLFNLSMLLSVSVFVSGCSSISKGITEALLEQKVEDTRACEIVGGSFNGISNSLAMQEKERAGGRQSSRQAKVLMVHGIGKHEPGYSTGLREKLTTKLGLSLISKEHKEFEITSIDYGEGQSLGIVRVTKHVNEDRTQELFFYELTWSKITDDGKESLIFDSSGEYSFKRATINKHLKEFLNKAIPDLLVYRGKDRGKINAAIGQATCWLFNGDWESLPKDGVHYCNALNVDFSKHIRDDDFYFITHSLGVPHALPRMWDPGRLPALVK